MPSLKSLLSGRRSPFAGPGESGRKVWRAAGETVVAGVVTLIVFEGMDGLGEGHDADLTLLLALCAFVLLLVRRRFPVTSVLALSAVMGALPAVGMLTSVAAYTATRQLAVARQRTVLLVVGSALSVLSAGLSAPSTGLGGHGFGLALGAVLAATTVIVPGLVGTAKGQQDRLMLALRERTAAAEEAERQAEGASRIAERSRIAAEMHDLVGHRLSLISLHAGGLELALQKQAPELQEEAALVRGATRDAMRELREALGVLGPLGRDTGTDALTDATGTRADIEALVEESRSGGVLVDFAWEGPDLDTREPRLRRAVHRVVREALTNVHRYAAGSRVDVRVTHDDDQVTVTVRNGVPPVGTPPPVQVGTGRGLTGLRERVELLGGTLGTGPTPGGGFAVSAVLPSEPEAGRAAPSPYGEKPEVPSGRTLSGVQRRLADTAGALLGLAGMGVLMMLGLILLVQAQPAPETENAKPPHIGMTREELERSWYSDSDEARAAAYGHEPPRPASATSCMYPHWEYEPKARVRGELELKRFCFTGDRLTAIDSFTVPMVTEPEDRPTPTGSPSGSSSASSSDAPSGSPSGSPGPGGSAGTPSAGTPSAGTPPTGTTSSATRP